MTKICFCTTIPLTINAFIRESAEYIHEHTDWDISFICSSDDEFAASLPEYIHYYPVDMKRGLSFDAFRVIKEMKAIFQRERFDLVQYSTPNAAFYASIAARSAGIPVRNYHLMGFRYLGSSGIMRKVLKRLEITACKNATDIECVSRSNMELGVREKLFSPEKAVIVWNGSSAGVDLQRFSFENRNRWRRDFRAELGLDDSCFVYGFVGRITRDKGVDELLEAFLSLQDGSKLLLTGFTDDMGTLNSELLLRAENSPDVIFHESLNEIERCYAALDVLILPSYREGFGNVVIEAAAVGTPAIVSEIPGPVDAVVKDETALTVEVKNVEALVSAMKRIRTIDYVKMGESAVKYVREHFDSQVYFEKNLERKRALLEKGGNHLQPSGS